MEQICAVCVYAKPMVDGTHMLCEKKGPVLCTASCKKHVTDLTKIELRRKRDIAKPASLQNT